MSDAKELKPLKTWSHLAARRRKPSEYEIVSTNLHMTAGPDSDAPVFEIDPDAFMNRWYREKRDSSPLKHPDWNAFRDPDEQIYRTYNLVQDGAETYVMGLFDQFNEREYDTGLSSSWAGTLARLYAPGRYLFHALQMCSAYLVQMGPSSTISICAAFQCADSLRWLSHVAYRSMELSSTFPDKGFGINERQYWEEDAAWQGFRELIEKVLATYDWGESFVALNLVAKPAVEEAVLRKLGEAARHNDDPLLALVVDAELIDAARHRRWASALVEMATEEPGNADVIKEWIAKWEPLADRAIDAFCDVLSDVPNAASGAKQATRAFRHSLFDF